MTNRGREIAWQNMSPVQKALHRVAHWFGIQQVEASRYDYHKGWQYRCATCGERTAWKSVK